MSWDSPASPQLRAGAGAGVVLIHAVVVGALLIAGPDVMPVSEPEAVSVRFVELAPVVQAPEAPPAPTPPAPQPEVKPVPKPQPKPKPVPPKPVPPKPAEQPKPAPEPLPVSETAVSAPPSEPVPDTSSSSTSDAAADSRPPTASTAPASGAAQASDRAASPQAPTSDQPRLVGQVDYAGQPPVPVYPRMSQRLREQGRVLVRVLINPRGSVDRVAVQQSSGYQRLDDAAVEAMRRARFKPYTENGVAYPAQADIPVNFTLRD